jgi:hypothetical protein
MVEDGYVGPLSVFLRSGLARRNCAVVSRPSVMGSKDGRQERIEAGGDSEARQHV